MKYKGKLDFRIGVLKRLWKCLKKSKSFLIQRLIRKMKKEGEEEDDSGNQEKVELLRAIDSNQIKILAMVILRAVYNQEIESHYTQIEQEVRLFNLICP